MARIKRLTTKRQAAKQQAVWTQLTKLIQAYADAQEADSWKGGGDPEEFEMIELRLQLARIELNTHIAQMKRELS